MREFFVTCAGIAALSPVLGLLIALLKLRTRDGYKRTPEYKELGDVFKTMRRMENERK